MTNVGWSAPSSSGAAFVASADRYPGVMAVQSNRAMRPFWMHQVVEYVIGASFISAAIPSSTPIIPIVLGVVVLVNAAVGIGPAGAFRLVHRQVHRVFDLAIMGLILLAAIQPVYEVQSATRALMMALGLVMAFIWWNTDFATRDERKERRGSRSSGAARSAGQAVSAKTNPKSETKQQPDGDAAGRSAGRSAAQTYLAAKRLKKAMVDDRNKSDSA